jgi:arsenite methyltransferase
MATEINLRDREKIEASIREKYSKVARVPDGLFKYPTGVAGLRALHYDPAIIESLPEAILDSYCGVGNLFALGPIHPGERVLDVGCGAGVDTLIAAKLTGPTGVVAGIDLVPNMLVVARENAILADICNVIWIEASSENLPLAGSTFDIVISNGVFNLVIDKAKSLREVFRVLKPGGHLQVADQVLTDEQFADPEDRVKSWFQ